MPLYRPFQVIIVVTCKEMLGGVRGARGDLVQLVLHDLQVELHHVVAAQALKVVRHCRHMDVHLRSSAAPDQPGVAGRDGLWSFLTLQYALGWHLLQARHARRQEGFYGECKER